MYGRFWNGTKWVDVIPYGKFAGNKVPSTAVQYVKVGQKWVNIATLNKDAKAADGFAAKSNADKLAALTYPLGSVYEAVNDEQQQTTVLIWNVGSQVDSVVANTYKLAGTTYTWTDNAADQTQAVSIAKAIEKSGASAASKGVSTEDIQVTICFKQKDQNHKYIETNAIYVTLVIPAGKLHFAYAEASGKDLSHWYLNNGYQNSDDELEADAAEIHINVPTPALGGSGAELTRTGSNPATFKGLQDIDFGKVIDQTFISNLVNMGSFDKNNFSKFVDTKFSFNLVKPVQGVNATDLNAAETTLSGAGNTSIKKADSWIVKGVTGNEYLIYLAKSDDADSIVIAGYKDVVDGKVKTISDKLERTVVILKRGIAGAVTETEKNPTGVGTKIALMPNRYAQDIVNYTGRFDMFGTNNNTTYLNNEGKTFTAFIEILPSEECYKLMMPNSYFKARFLRPINVIQNTQNPWTDATNDVQKKPVYDFVKIVDWRGYNLGLKNEQIVENGAIVPSKSTIDARFYGIADSTFHHYWIDMNHIYTDHGKAKTARAVKTSVEDIEALDLTSAFESLSPTYLYLEADYTNGAKSQVLCYRNNEANVGTFHLYVPVYVAYSFGEFDYNGAYGADGSASPMALKSAVNGAARFNWAAAANTNALYKPFVGNRAIGTANSMDKATNTGAATDATLPIYTQKVYAVIEVRQTVDSQTQARKK